MAQIRLSPSAPPDLRNPPFMDASLVPPLPPPDPPHSFSYLLSMQDMIRYPPDSAAASSSFPDHGIDFSLLASSPCSTTDHDHGLMETISEDDRATLLPIIRIAFPSLRHTTQDPFADRLIGTTDRMRHVSELEESHYQSLCMEQSKHETEGEAFQYYFNPTVPSLVQHSSSVYGVQSQEEPRHWPLGSTGVRNYKTENLESAGKIDEMISCQRSDPSTITEDRFSVSIGSGCGGLEFPSSFNSAINVADHIALRNPWVQGQTAPHVEESSDLIHERQFDSGPSSVFCRSPCLEIRGLTSGEDVDRQALEKSPVHTSKESTPIITSEPEERTSFGMGSDVVCGAMRPNEAQNYPLRTCQDLSPVAVSKLDHFKFPEVNRKRRNVIKKAVGWVRKRRTAQSFSARVSHKRKCSSGCCTGCELGLKRRKISAYSASGVVRNFSTFSQVRTLSKTNKSTKYVKPIRKLSTVTSLNSDSSAMDTSPVHTEASPLTPEWVNSPLSTALFLVVLESGSNGVTVCEALRKLVKQDCSKLFNSNTQPRAVQVKMALRRCPDFKELHSRRFILRNRRKPDDRRPNIKGAVHEENTIATDEPGQEKTLGPCQKTRISRGYLQQLKRTSVAGCLEERKCHDQEQKSKQCRKTDGKQWRCSQQAKPGFLYCEHHHQCRNKAKIKGRSLRKNAHRDIQRQKAKQSHTEEESQTVADSCLGQSREHSQGEEPKHNRCRRTDGRHWQCSKQVKPGSIYCEHHQGRLKKGTAKSSGPGQFIVARQAKQGLQITGQWDEDTAGNGVKGKANSNKHGSVLIAKEPKQDLQASAVDGLPMASWKGKVKGNGHAHTATAQETQQGLHVLNKPQTGAHGPSGKPKGSRDGQTSVTHEAKQEMTGLKMGAAPYGWKGKANRYRQGDVSQVLQVAVDMSKSAVDSWKRKAKPNRHAQIRKEKDSNQALQVGEPVSSTRSSAALKGLRPAEKSGDVQGKDEQLSERCHRRDGKQWQCSQQCKPGHIYCEHHQRHHYRSKGRAVFSKQTKALKQKEQDNRGLTGVDGFSHLDSKDSQGLTGVDGFSHLDGKDRSVKPRGQLHSGGQLQRETSYVDDHIHSPAAIGSKFGDADEQHLKRCHRTDGKGWQCSHLAKYGFNYCEHHQGYLSRRTTPKKESKKGRENQSLSGSVKSSSDVTVRGCSSGSEIPKLTHSYMQPAVL